MSSRATSPHIAWPGPPPPRADVGDGRARGDELRPRSRLRVEPVEAREQNSAALARGLGEEIIGEPGRTEDAEDCAGGVVSGRGQQITDVFEPAQLCGARPPDSTLRLAQESDSHRPRARRRATFQG